MGPWPTLGNENRRRPPRKRGPIVRKMDSRFRGNDAALE